MKKFILTAVTLLTLSAVGAIEQVTIGSTVPPQPFSVLDLDGHGDRGMRLPQFKLCEYNDLTTQLEGLTGEEAKKAQGLQIFNTCTKCVNTWNGSKWIEQCWKRTDCVEMPKIVTCPDCMCIPTVRFAKFNLGADESLDTPKKQMKYLAEHAFSVTDAHVYGGLFQWGRKWDKTSDATSYPVSVENNTYKRYAGKDNRSTSMLTFTLYDNYDTSGQPKTNIGDHLYSNNANN
jgi:hypothetical protein